MHFFWVGVGVLCGGWWFLRGLGLWLVVEIRFWGFEGETSIVFVNCCCLLVYNCLIVYNNENDGLEVKIKRLYSLNK